MRLNHVTRLCVGVWCTIGLLLSGCVRESEATLDVDPFPAAKAESVGLDAAALERLSDVVQGYVDADEIVGAELLIVKNRRTVLHRAFGWRDREDEIPMTLDTIFNIRSMTKPLTGAAAQILFDEGVLSLDDFAGNYVEGFGGNASRDITIDHLLTHRSGLPLTVVTHFEQYADLQSLARAAGAEGPEFPPGSQFQYSDAGSDVLGAVVSRAAGRPLDEFVGDRILEPTGMKDSFYYTTKTAEDARKERIASAYLTQGGGFTRYWVPSAPLYPFAWGSQTLYSTPLDYARFLSVWLDGGAWNGARILSTEAVERTLQPISPMTSLFSTMPMPTGFFRLQPTYGRMAILYLDESGETILFGHSGSDGTHAWAWPKEDLMILLFTQSRGSTAGTKFEAEIDRILLHPEIDELNDEARRQFERLLGSFVPFGEERPMSSVSIVIRNGQLGLDVPQETIYSLTEAQGDHRWRLDPLPDHFVTFLEEEDGSISGFLLASPSGADRFIRGDAYVAPTLTADEVEPYLGTYLDEAAGREIEVLFVAGQLTVQLPESIVPLELLPPDEKGWWRLAMNPAVSLRFDRDASGAVVSFTARSPEGTDVRPRVARDTGASTHEGGD